MGLPPSIVAAMLMQLCGISLFMRRPAAGEKACAAPPQSAPVPVKWVYGLSLLFLLLWSWEVLPNSKLCLGAYPRFYIGTELLGTVFVSELAILIGWCSYERLVHQLSQLLCRNCRWCGYFTLGMLTLLPSAGLLFTLAPAQWREFVVQLLWQLPRPEADECLLTFTGELSNYISVLVSPIRLRDVHCLRFFQLREAKRKAYSETVNWTDDADADTPGYLSDDQ